MGRKRGRPKKDMSCHKKLKFSQPILDSYSIENKTIANGEFDYLCKDDLMESGNEEKSIDKEAKNDPTITEDDNILDMKETEEKTKKKKKIFIQKKKKKKKKK